MRDDIAALKGFGEQLDVMLRKATGRYFNRLQGPVLDTNEAKHPLDHLHVGDYPNRRRVDGRGHLIRE